MKKFKILLGLPQCNTGTPREPMLLGNGANRLARHRIATNFQLVKNTLSGKRHKAKHNKTKHACHTWGQLAS